MLPPPPLWTKEERRSSALKTRSLGASSSCRGGVGQAGVPPTQGPAGFVTRPVTRQRRLHVGCGGTALGSLGRPVGESPQSQPLDWIPDDTARSL